MMNDVNIEEKIKAKCQFLAFHSSLVHRHASIFNLEE